MAKLFRWLCAKPWRLVVWGLAIAALVAALGFGVWVANVIYLFRKSGECGYEPRQEILSPDGKTKAAVIEVNCGAASSYRDWIVRGPANRPFNYERDLVTEVRGAGMAVAWSGPKLVVLIPAWMLKEAPKNLPADVEFRALPETSAPPSPVK